MVDEIDLRKLAGSDRRDAFDCGDTELNDFLKTKANQAQKRGQSVTIVAARRTEIVGFATILPASIESASLQPFVQCLPKHNVPVLLLARMGTTPKQGIGRRLMDVVFQRAVELRESYGCVGVLTDAKRASVGFYEHFDFVSLDPPDTEKPTTRMFMVPPGMRHKTAR